MEVGKLLVGKENQRLKCEECGILRQTVLPFNSIQLSVNKSKTIQDALKDYSASEVLSDAIECSGCNTSTYMTKSLVITDAPPILLIHLLRYEYDRKRCSKKKIQNHFEFSEEIDVAGVIYVLTSVIYHIGTSAHGGHYVCDCRSWRENRWFHFDDESSVEIPPPFSSATTSDEVKEDGTTDLTTEENQTVKKSDRKRKRVKTEKKEDVIPVDDLISPALNRKTDCYLLFYVRKSLISDTLHKADGIINQNESLRAIVAKVNEENALTEKEVARVKLLSEEWLRTFEQRKLVYDEIQSILTPKSIHDDFILVHGEKLKRWINGHSVSFRQNKVSVNTPSTDKQEDEVEIVESIVDTKRNTTAMKCSHGKISPNSLSNYKVLSKEAYEKIVENLLLQEQQSELYLSVEASRNDLICHACGSNREDSNQQIISEQLKIDKLLKEIQRDLDAFSEGREGSDSTSKQEQVGFWLSKKFLQELKKYFSKLINETVKYATLKQEHGPLKGNINKKIDVNTIEHLRSTSFTLSLPYNGKIWCDEHNQLCLDVRDHAFIIGERCMKMIEEHFQPCISCSAQSDLCQECNRERENKELTSNQYEISRQEQKNDEDLMDLFKRKNFIPPELIDLKDKGKRFYFEHTPHSSSIFYFVNAQWMSQWRAFIRNGTKAVDKLSFESMLCQHGNLFAEDTLNLAEGEMKQLIEKLDKEDQLPQMEVIRVNEFQKLCLLYEEHHFNNKMRKVETSARIPDILSKPHIQVMHQQQNISFQPDFCRQCLQDRWDLFKTNTQYFTNAVVSVLYFGSKDLMTDFKRKRDSGQKVVIRSRGSSLQKFSVSVSHDETVGLVKLKIFESCHAVDLPPAQQILFDELGQELEDNNKKLSECGIRSENMIFVIKTPAQGGAWVDGFYDCYQSGQQEEGFKGGIWNTGIAKESSSNNSQSFHHNGDGTSGSGSSQIIEIIDE